MKFIFSLPTGVRRRGGLRLRLCIYGYSRVRLQTVLGGVLFAINLILALSANGNSFAFTIFQLYYHPIQRSVFAPLLLVKAPDNLTLHDFLLGQSA
jgi:hypothetical protein